MDCCVHVVTILYVSSVSSDGNKWVLWRASLIALKWRNDSTVCLARSDGLNAKAKFHYRSLSYNAWYCCRLSFTLLRLLPNKGGCTTPLQTYHQLLQHFGTSISNAYSTHFVKSSDLNAKAKFYYRSLPGTIVGCHLLCVGSCLTRGVVLQLQKKKKRKTMQAVKATPHIN